MSHMTLEYSANLRADGRFGDLCRELARYMVELRVDGPAGVSAGRRTGARHRLRGVSASPTAASRMPGSCTPS